MRKPLEELAGQCWRRGYLTSRALFCLLVLIDAISGKTISIKVPLMFLVGCEMKAGYSMIRTEIGCK